MALGRNQPVLVVENYQTMTRILRNLLSQLGFKDVDDAESCEQALDMMRQRDYALVIADWVMDGMSGLEMLESIRADGDLRDTPFIMVSAVSKTESVRQALKAGANGYIVKPFTAQTLDAKIVSIHDCNWAEPSAAAT